MDETEAAGEASGLRPGRVAAAAAATAAASTEGSLEAPDASRARLAAASRSRASSVMGSTDNGLGMDKMLRERFVKNASQTLMQKTTLEHYWWSNPPYQLSHPGSECQPKDWRNQ